MVILFLHFIPTPYAIQLQTQVCWNFGVNASIHAQSNNDSFADFIRSSGLWADKSLLIKTVMKEKSKILLIGSPRGWCKSLNLKMLQSFFDIEVDDNCERKPLNETFAYNYFQNGVIRPISGITQKIHPIPLISKHRNMTQALGQFPVIFLNFAKVLFDKELLFFHGEFDATFAPYIKIFDGIIDGNSTSSELKIRTKRCKEIIFNSGRIAPEVLLSSIVTLSEVLYTHYGKKVIILIDEYDQFVRDMYFDVWTTYKEEDRFHIKNFYKKFTQLSFYSNKYLEKAVIATVLPTWTLLGFNRTNAVREYKIIDGDDIYNFFGFTTLEVFIMMRIREIPDVQRDAVINWYGGYNSPSSPSGFLFSPSSVARFIEDKKIIDYPSTGSMLDEFTFEWQKFPVFRNTLISLINDTTYVVDYSKTEMLVDRDCSLMNTFVMNKTIGLDDFRKEHCDIALTLLCNMGYFTVDDTFANNGTNGTHIGIMIPNEEIENKLRWKIDYNRND